MKLLAIGAHPDDLEIFGWGALSAWADAGAELHLATATDGARGGTGPDLAQRRKAESRAAADMLRVEPRFLDFPDGSLLPDRALDAALGALFDDIRPDLLLTHAPNDYHPDHRALAVAAQARAGFDLPVVFFDTLNGTGFTPTHWIDTTAHHPAKRAAIRCHASQAPERFVAMADRWNAFRAGQANGPSGSYAEAIRFEPRFPFADIRALLPPAPPLRPVLPRDS